ncbi:MAG: DUF58 domain-containing protein [Candidatus Jordarchaeales archaeon]
MVKVRVGATGSALIFSSFALALLSLLFMDLAILLAAITSALMALYASSVAALKARWLARNLRFVPKEVSLRLVAGTRQIVKMRVEAPKHVEFSVRHPLNFCRVKPDPCRANDQLEFELSPEISRVHESEWLEIKVNSPLKAFTAEANAPFKTCVTVLPRVVPAIIRALEVASSLAVVPYEVPLQSIGRGTEYAQTREYAPGDDLRRMDWKATARLQKLMVKQHHQEAGGKANIVYDLKVAGPVSRDKAATEFLNLVVALTTQNLPYTITVVDEEGHTQTLSFKDGRSGVITAVKYALKSVEVDFGILYELMDPRATEEALMLLKIVEEDQSISEGRGEKPLEEPYDARAITCLLGDLTWLMDLHERARRLGGSLTVNVPSQIWLDSPTLEQAYMDLEGQLRVMASLRRRGIEVKTHATHYQEEKFAYLNNR